MPKKLKGTHVFQPSDGSHGVVNNLGKSWSAASPNPSVVSPSAHNPPLAITTMIPETPFQNLLLLYLLACHPLSSQPTVAPSINILLTNLLVPYLPLPMSMPMASCLFQMQMCLLAVRLAQTQSNKPSVLLSTSEELKEFNNTIKDLLKSKEANRRQEQQEWVSSSEHQMKAMTTLQEQESSWLTFDHLIAMIDHFKLNLGATNTYMSIQCPILHKLWVKKQLMDMQYKVDKPQVEENEPHAGEEWAATLSTLWDIVLSKFLYSVLWINDITLYFIILLTW